MKLIPICGIMILMTELISGQGIARVWAVDDGEKIKKEDVNNALALDRENAVWHKNSINIFGGRNEIVAFQLIIEADAAGAEGVNVKTSDLKRGNSLIPGSESGPADPFDYRGRCIELFTEHYFKVEKQSPPLWFYAKEAPLPGYYMGMVPDCLILFQAPAGKGGAPFDIDPATNQGVWVDIYIPENIPAGIYKGKVIVSVADKVYKSIPLSLEVFDFSLPDSTHIRSMFGLYEESVATRHNVKSGSDEYYNIEAKYYQLAHRHRFDLVRRISNLKDMTLHQKKYFTGETYTKNNGYEGPGENTGNTTFSIGFGAGTPVEYGGPRMKNVTETSWRSGSDAWEKWFIENAPSVERHKYLYPDEPDFKGPEGAKGVASVDTIRMQARWTHNNPGPGRNIPCLVTNTVKPEYDGFVDFWSVSSQEAVKEITKEMVGSEKTKGNKFGIYNGYRPGMGTVLTDADAVDFRVMPWIVWKHGLDQYFYWAATYWTRLNVFKDPLTFRNMINGDGTFLYPGEDKLFPEESRNLAGPLSSIRAKNWRRGAQDYEYLWIARKAGLGKEADEIVRNCIPTSLWEANSQKDVTWPSRGNGFEKYRRKLAELISSAAKTK